MTTKDYCLSLNNKQKIFVNDNSVNGQYSNLNLNQIHQNPNANLIKPKSISFEHKKSQNCESKQIFNVLTKIGQCIAAIKYKLSVNNSKPKINDVFWFESKKNLPSLFESEKDEGLKEDSCVRSSSSNNSTLSLHISAYENSVIEKTANLDSKNERKNWKLKKEKSNLIKKWKNSKQICSTFQNPFEFPRQQKSANISDPEIMQFKASQKLSNLNHSKLSAIGLQKSSKKNHLAPQKAHEEFSSTPIARGHEKQDFGLKKHQTGYHDPKLSKMSSKFGTRPAGTDGTDFQHRQRIAAQYQTSASYKFYLKALFGLHFTVLLAIWAKVFGEIAVTQFGIKSALWKRLDLPSAYPWEYVWCFSIVPIILGLYAMPKNRVKPMTYAYYGQFFTGILPCSLGLGSQFPELIAYIADPVNNETPTIKGSFPMVVIWFIFFLIAFQLHIFAMYFKYYLLAAWNPLPVTTPTEETTKDEKEKKSD